MEKSKSSRRIFLEKMASGGAAIALSGSIPAKLFAGTDRRPVPGGDPEQREWTNESGKKFVPVMITPFEEKGGIDFNGLDRLIEFYLAAGVKGFFANCNSSEMYQLTNEERLSLAGHVVKKVNGKVSVVATGSFGDTMEDKAEFAKKMYQTGVNAVILITSHYAGKEESDEVLFRNFENMCRLTGNMPLGFYECPSPYKRIINPGLFKQLLDTDRLIYFKDTSIDREKIRAKLALIKNNPMEFYDAHTPNAMFSLQLGAKGMACIAGNFYPEILAWMCNHANDPAKREDVQWLQAELTKADPVISHHYPMSAKYFLHKRGVPVRAISRMSPAALSDTEKQTLDSMHDTLRGWQQRLGIQTDIKF